MTAFSVVEQGHTAVLIAQFPAADERRGLADLADQLARRVQAGWQVEGVVATSLIVSNGLLASLSYSYIVTLRKQAGAVLLRGPAVPSLDLKQRQPSPNAPMVLGGPPAGEILIGIALDKQTGVAFNASRIFTLGAAAQLSEEELLRLPGIGHARVAGLKAALHERGLQLREEEPLKPPDLGMLDEPLEHFDLSVRARRACESYHKACTVRDLVQLTPAQILKAPNCSRRTLREITEVLHAHGLHLGMTPEEVGESRAVR